MRVGGLLKTSLIDYPGKVSCVLFLSGCNFDCPYCHNPQLAKGFGPEPRLLGGDLFYDFLDRRRTFLDGVVISGGEPTLDKDLVSLCENIKKLGYPIKLDTNGSRPQVLETLVEKGLVDYIAMDVKTDFLHYAPFIQRDHDPDPILRSIRIIMASLPDYEFRTTCVRPFIDEGVIENIARTIEGAKLYALQTFHRGEILHPEFFENRDAVYDEIQVTAFKSIAAPWVEECIVR